VEVQEPGTETLGDKSQQEENLSLEKLILLIIGR
jgi:hypothetical protein